MSSPTEAAHAVDFDANSGEVVFTCTGDQTSECHIWPDDLEYWDDTTPRDTFVPHDRCWMFDWFDNHAVEYTGGDGVEADDSYGNTIPSAPRSGPIKATFQQDFIEWGWT